MTNGGRRHPASDSGRERGATLIEVMIAMVVLGIGLMAASQMMLTAVSSVLISQDQLIGKQKAREALESVFTARNTQNVLWEDIRNVDDGGVFLAGYQPLTEMGIDGIANTADDADADMATVVLPGPDGDLGTGDDIVQELDNFERSIAITDVLLPNDAVDPDIRQVEVLLRYTHRGIQRTVRLSTLISRFS